MIQATLRLAGKAALAVALAGTSVLAHAQDAFPSHPINLVSPFPPGGATDMIARVLGDAMSKRLGQSVVVVNRPGGGTTIGAAYVARERPDGYTLLLATSSTLITSRFLYKNLQFDPDAMVPVGVVGTAPMILLTSKKRGFHDAAGLVDYARKHPGDLSVASQGSGTLSHLLAECFQSATQTRMTHIPYKGSSEAMPALINGDVDVFFDNVGTGMAQVKGGRAEVLGGSGRQRLSEYPEIPTLDEAGFPGCDLSAWWALMAPPATPPAVVARLNEALKAALKEDTVRRKILEAGTEPADGAIEPYAGLVRADVPLIGELVKRANVTVQ